MKWKVEHLNFVKSWIHQRKLKKLVTYCISDVLVFKTCSKFVWIFLQKYAEVIDLTGITTIQKSFHVVIASKRPDNIYFIWE